MCGIGGAFATDGSLPDRILEAVRRLPSALRHRGPDALGVWVSDDRSVALAATRLAVRDLRPEANQPFHTVEGTTVYNGELYRWPPARMVLGGARAFRTSADTEVVHEIMCRDPRLLDGVAGMYATATWRADSGSLWLARDRMGEKPLYLVEADNWVAFASELKALVGVGLLDRRIDPDALSLFLRLGHVPDPWTIYRGARALPAGAIVEIGRDGRHYAFKTLSPRRQPAGGRATSERLRTAVLHAVEDALVSDVPTGLFLSGGVDSAVIAAACAKSGHHPLAITLTASSWRNEESAEAAQTAAHLGLPHRIAYIEPPEALAQLPRYFQAMDQPTVDGFNSFLIARAAREAGMTVALSGIGGDELFRGYQTFRDIAWLRLVSGRPGVGLVSHGLRQLARHRPISDRLSDALAARSLTALYMARRGVLGSRTSRSLLGHTPAWENAYSRNTAVPKATDSVSGDQEVAWLETTCYLRNQLLRDTDVFSMANSLEVRAPLLIPDVVALGLGQPNARRFRGKTALRAAFANDLPDGALDRPKRGFILPWDSWLRGGMSSQVDAALHDSRFSRSFLQPSAVDAVQVAFQRGQAHWSALWVLAVLCLWDEAQQNQGAAAL